MEDWTGILFLFNLELLTDRFPLICNFRDIVHIQYVCIKFWLYLLKKLIILHFCFLFPVFSFSFTLQVSFSESPCLLNKRIQGRTSSLKFVCNSRDYSFNLPTTRLTSHKRKIKVSSRGRQEMSLHKVHILYNLCHFKVSNSWIPLVCTCTFLSFGRAEVFHSDISLMYAWDHSGKGQETRSSWF